MPPASRAQLPPGLTSKSTPNLPTRASLDAPRTASPRSPLSTPAAVDDNEDAKDTCALEASEGSDSSESDGDAREDMDTPPAARPLYTSRSYSHLPRQPATALYPPFYNRPPVPLPPSPSLTSLLRPAFSAATSRPTTPDSSDVELPPSSANLARLTDSARNAPAVPRAAPKAPTYEYYGFAVYLGSSAAFLMYVLWAYVPAPLLHQMGIWWYPDRWWALAVPSWLVVLVVYIYVALASYNTTYLTLPLASCENLVDDTAQVAVVECATGRIRRGGTSSADVEASYFGAGERVDWSGLWNVGTDAVMDVPVGGVCEILYGGDG